MKRRDFFAASAVAGLGIQGMAGMASAATSAAGKDFLALSTFHFASTAKLEAFDQFLADAAIPAMNRAGVEPVGVFRLFKDDNPKLNLEADGLELFILLPHKSLDSVATMMQTLSDDDAFLAAGEGVLDAPKSDPAYLRFESTLLLAFDEMPHVEVPSTKDTRVLQLRIYESHSWERHVKKVQMFNEGGEIDIFRRTGLPPVFFGAAIFGDKLPNLTYMVGFDDLEALEAGWKTFVASDGWNELKKDEQYKDTVSNITNLILRPGVGSQI